VTNDIHYLAGSLHDDGKLYQQLIYEQDGKNTEMTDQLMQSLVYTVARDKPDILLLNGDLTFQGEKASHEGLVEYLAKIEALGVKVYAIPGNHDVNNPYAAQYIEDYAVEADLVDPEEFERIYHDFGYGEAISREKESLSYVAEPMPGLRLLMLDSCWYLTNLLFGESDSSGQLSDATRKWIARAVKSAKRSGARLVVSMHHNLMDHHPMVNRGFTIDDAESAREFFSKRGINFVLTGHIHAQEISGRETSTGTVYDIATSAFSVYPHQLGVLRLADDAAWRYSVTPVDVESWARDTGVSDTRLLKYKTYSAEFFKRSAVNMVNRRLTPEVAAALPPEDLQALVDLMGTLNVRYFSGTEDLNAQDIPQSRGYQLLASGKFESLKRYAATIMEDKPPSNIDFVIPAR
jgi:3',5'-cyclic AMP phosphodiesterase CpdA